MKFNSNKERRAWWEWLMSSRSEEEIEAAMKTLKPDTVKVLRSHYGQGRSFREIALLMNRSLTLVRNHHNRGIYKLYRYFNPRSSETV